MAQDLKQRSKIGAVACGLLVTAVGVTVLAGWVTGSNAVSAIYRGGIVIKTNTGIALLCLGLSLVTRVASRSESLISRFGSMLAMLACAIGLATLCEHLFGWDLRIDQLLFTEPAGSPATASPNRMGPPASLCLPLIGFALLLIDRRTNRGRAPAQSLALAAMLIASASLLGYIFRVHALYGIAQYTGIALNTAVALFVAAMGIFLARPEMGAMRRLLADDPGGLLLRRLIPATIVLPVVLATLRVAGERAGWYDVEFGRSLLVLSFIVVFATVTWWAGVVVQRHAAAQVRAEAAERFLHQRLADTLESERHARAAAERSSHMKDEFLATLSHELRTPLSAMLGWAQLLLAGGLSERDTRRGVEAIERNAKLQAQLIGDLLDMSRIEAGKIYLDVEAVDLARVIDSVLAAAAPSIDAAAVTIERHVDASVPLVHGDSTRLQQVLWNLVSNAIKFTSRGGRVVVSLTRQQAHAVLAVRDTGVGIRREFLPHVFDRFRQADATTTRRYGGLGLGLSIAQQLVQMHGGVLTAESDGDGCGATFTVTLPMSAKPLADRRVPGAVDAADLERARVSLTGRRVLIVDDDADACELVTRILRDGGAAVTAASSVDEALSWLERRTFDVLVSDISMPVRDGYDLITQVRDRYPNLPAIALTALARVEDEQRVLAAGFRRHLSKPISPELLIQAVAAIAPPNVAPATAPVVVSGGPSHQES